MHGDFDVVNDAGDQTPFLKDRGSGIDTTSQCHCGCGTIPHPLPEVAALSFLCSMLGHNSTAKERLVGVYGLCPVLTVHKAECVGPPCPMKEARQKDAHPVIKV